MKTDASKIALVTGGNRGIGHEIVKELAERGWTVFLAARDAQAGKRAAERLGRPVKFLELDVANPASIHRAAEAFGQQATHLDVLINNAGILLDRDGTALDVTSDVFERTMQTNVLGPLLVTEAFAPYLRKSKNARVINVSSGAGQLSSMGTYAPAYSISKTALNAVTRQLAGAMDYAQVNSACPGWVRTDMGGSGAPRSVEEGADTIVWLATEAPKSTTGQFLQDRRPMEW